MNRRKRLIFNFQENTMIDPDWNFNGRLKKSIHIDTCCGWKCRFKKKTHTQKEEKKKPKRMFP